MEYHCKISAYWDEATYDNLYSADSNLITEDCFDEYESAMVFLKKVSKDDNVNCIEIITANGASNRHVSFYRPEHPFAETEYEFGDIEWFVENEKNDHTKRLEDPEPFDIEMQYIDLFAGLSPEMIAEGKTAKELLDDIPEGKEQLKNLFKLICKSYIQVSESFDLEKTFNWGLPYFLAGITEASQHTKYWEQAWKGEYDELYSVYYRNYEEKDDVNNMNTLDEISFTYFFLGVYFIGLRIYVA